MKDINIGILPENKTGYYIDSWVNEIENIFSLMPKIKYKVLDHLKILDPSKKVKYNYLVINVGKNKKFEITIKMREDTPI